MALHPTTVPDLQSPASSPALAVILCVAALLRTASVFLLHAYRNPKTWEFGEIAHVIMAGHGYTAVLGDGVRVPSAYMPPLYPYLLTTVWTLFGESARTYLAIELVQAFLGVLLVLVLYRLAALLFSARVATAAAAMAAVWPAFIYLCNEFHSINLYIVLGVAAVYHLVRYIEVSRSWEDAVSLGLYMGALLYCRAEAVALLALYALVLLWRCGRQAALPAAAVCCIALACLSPWAIRNYRVFGHPVLVTTSSGFNLWIGHNPRAAGNSNWDFSYITPQQQGTLKSLMGHPDSEILVYRQYRVFAVEFARSHPREEARLLARKLFLFLLFDPQHAKGSKFVYWGPSLVLLLLAVYGAWLRRDQLLRRDLPVTVTVAFAFLLSLAVFTLPRYRIAIDPFLVLFAASAVLHFVPAKGPALAVDPPHT